MRVLFICNQHLHRSTTAEHLFEKRFVTRSAGLYNAFPVTKQQLLWADLIAVMEDEQRTELSRRFPEIYIQKKIISLGIPDVYYKDQPELITLLRQRMKKLLA